MEFNTDFNTINKKINEFCNNNIIDKEIKNIDFLFTIPDIHGDVMALIDILSVYNFITITKSKDDLFDLIKTYKYIDLCQYININESLQNIVLVQTGDILDGYRSNHSDYDYYYNHDEEALNIMLKIQKQANELDRNVHVILLYGNHEINNLLNLKITKNTELRLNKDGMTKEQFNDNLFFQSWKKIPDMNKLYTFGVKPKSPIDNYILASIKTKTIGKYQEYILSRYDRFKKIFKDLICNYMSIVKINNIILSHTIITQKTVLLLFNFAQNLYYYYNMSMAGLLNKKILTSDDNAIKEKIEDNAKKIFNIDNIKKYSDDNTLQNIINSYIRYAIYILYYAIFMNNDIKNIPDENIFQYMNLILYIIFSYDPFKNRENQQSYQDMITNYLSFKLKNDKFLNRTYPDLDLYPNNIYKSNMNIENEINTKLSSPSESGKNIRFYNEFTETSHTYTKYEIPNNIEEVFDYYSDIIRNTMDLYNVNQIFIGHIPHTYTIKHIIEPSPTSKNKSNYEMIYGDVAHSRTFYKKKLDDTYNIKSIVTYQFNKMVTYNFNTPFFNKDIKYSIKTFVPN